jgi:hypothetical protein
MKTKIRNLLSSKYTLLVVGILLGALVVLGVRFISYKPDTAIHYHANFGVFINGEQEQFADPSYYTEVETCADVSETNMQPSERAHMHDGVNNVAHVEDHAVTWGQLFQNLGWGFGENYLITRGGTIYANNEQQKLHVMINGQDYTDIDNIATRVIKDEDKLLLSYGNISADQVQQEYSSIPSTAHKYDITADPKSCSGHDGDTGLRARMMNMF